MHERAIVADLIRKASEVAHGHGAQRVVSMRVHVGALSHVDPVQLPAQVALAAVGTPAEGVTVEVTSDAADEALDEPGSGDVVLISVGIDAGSGPVDAATDTGGLQRSGDGGS
jgi:hypothetical protein